MTDRATVTRRDHLNVNRKPSFIFGMLPEPKAAAHTGIIAAARAMEGRFTRETYLQGKL